VKVINKTKWTTKSLKAILQRCAEEEFDDAAKRKRLVVTVDYTRGGGCSGHATLGGTRSTVRIEPPNMLHTTYEVCTQEEARDVGSYMREIKDGVTTWKRHVRVRRPHTTAELAALAVRFAKVACHEFAHNRGMNHTQMPSYYRWHGKWRERYAWAAAYPLVACVEKAKAPKTVDTKLAHVEKMLASATTRAKRAQTILKKWQRKQRYYVARQAASTKP
jgi:hypothetical protein